MGYIGLGVKVCWLALCTIGNIYQITQISDLFFKYETVSTVTVNFPDVFTAPAIGLCFGEIELVDFPKLEQFKPGIKKKLKLDHLSDEQIHEKFKSFAFWDRLTHQSGMYGNLSIKERSQVVASEKELFTYCGLTNPETTILDR